MWQRTIIDSRRRDYPSNVRRFRALGGMEKMLDLVLWTTSTFDTPEDEAPLSSSSGMDSNLSASRDGRALPRPSSVLLSMESTMKSGIRSPKPWNFRNPVLKLLFDIFFRITESEFNAWSKKGDHPADATTADPVTSPKRAAPSDMYTLVPFILDLFNENIRHTANNKRVRTSVKCVSHQIILIAHREHHPELQLFVLDFFTRVMDTDQFFSTNLLKMDILDVILGEYFTHLPISEFTKKLDNFAQAPLARPQERLLTETLHESTILFLSYLFTRAEANFVDLPRLIERIQSSLDFLSRTPSFGTPEFFYALFFVYHLSRVLFLVISNFPDNTTRALDQLDIHVRIVPCLNLIAGLTNVPMPSDTSIEKLVHREVLREAQEWIFFFTQIFLETPRGQRGSKSRGFARSEGYYRALFSTELIDTFFKLLEYPDTRAFGLLHIAKMMKVDITAKKLDFTNLSEKRNSEVNEPGITIDRHKAPLLSLYAKFLDFLVQIQETSVKSKSDEGYRSKRGLLLYLVDAGISEVIDNEGKKRSERQNNFRETNCFVKLLSLLHDEPTNESERKELGELSVTVLRALTRLMMGNQVISIEFAR